MNIRRRISPRSMIGILCAALAAAGAVRFMAPPPPGGTRGDVNFDAAVTVLDALATLQTTVGRALPEGMVADPNGDVDCSETVTSLDALIILSDIVGLDVSSSCLRRDLVAEVIAQPVDTLFVGDTTRYTVTLLSVDGDTLSDTLPGRKVRWTTSDGLLATIDTAGRVTAVGSGNPTLTATSERVSSPSVAVRVHPAVDSVGTSTANVSFNVWGGQQTLTASVHQAGGTPIFGVNPRWTSSDTLVAKVSATGVTTAVGNGSATITATAGGVTSPPVSVNVLQTISGICSVSPVVTQHTSNVTSDETWTKAGSPHMVTADVDVTGAVLTIEPGVVVCLGSFVDVDFVNGGRLVARGSPTDSIVFAAVDAVNPWGRLGFFGAPSDTSWITSTVIEDGGRGISGVVELYNTHPVVLDSSMIVRSASRGVYTNASSVRVSRTTIDDTALEGVRFDGPGILEESSVSNTGSGYTGVWVRAPNTIVRDFQISSTGAHGLTVDPGHSGVRVLRGHIGDAAQEGLQVLATMTELSDVRVVGSASYGFRGLMQNLNLLAPDSLSQDSLRGNMVASPGAADTVVITGGALSGAEQFVRRDLPWRVENDVSFVNAGARLRIEPGTRMTMVAHARLYFDNGGELWARGTPTDTIFFSPIDPAGYWEGLEFRSPPDPGAFEPPPPVDTSYITNAVLERSGRGGWWSIQAEEKHVVLIDSSFVRQMDYYGVYLNSPGSRISRSVVGPNNYQFAHGVELRANTTLDSVTVRGIKERGLLVSGSNVVVEDFQIDSAGGHGLEVACCGLSGIRVERGRILGSGGEGLRTFSSLAALSEVDVTGSGSYGFRGLAQNLNLLAPDSASQDLLVGNLLNSPGAADTLVVTGGAISGAEQFVRRDLPWRVENDVSFVNAGARLRIEPGTRMAMIAHGRLYFDNGGELWARGTPADTIFFSPIDPAGFWEGLEFRSPTDPGGFEPPFPPDTSYITNTVLERPGRGGWWSIQSEEKHVVLIDSAVVRLIDYNGVYLNSPGSRISRSVVGPNNYQFGNGIELRTNTALDTVTVRGIRQDAVTISGHNVVMRDFQIDSAGRYGLTVNSGLSGNSVERGTITDSGSEGLRVFSTLLALSQVDVSGSGSYGFRGLAQNLNLLAPDSASQVALLTGNTRDTLILEHGGAINGATQVVIPELPWRVEGDVGTIGAGGLLQVLPGATVAFNTNGQLYFDTGGRLAARGTFTDTVKFVSVSPPAFWETLRFMGSPGDTSWVTNALVEHAGRVSGWRPIFGESANHPVVVDSTTVRQADHYGVYLNGAGSRISRSIVTQNLDWEGVELGTGTLLENTTVHRAARTGIWVYGDNVTVRDFQVDSAGVHGLDTQTGRSGGSIERGTITASGSEGLRVLSPLVALSQVQVSNSGSYGFRGLAQNLNLIAPDSASHDQLLGNARDTLVLTGGAISGATQVVPPHVPWRVENDVGILGAGGLLQVRPGATVAFVNVGQLYFDTGGRLEARGTPTDSVRFVPVVPTDYWETLRFLGSPGDTSWVTNALVERAGRVSGWRPIFGESASHPVVVDSTTVRQSDHYGVYLNGAGSRISRSLVTQNVDWEGVELGTGTLLESTLVHRASRNGIQVFGNNVTVRDFQVDSAGQHGLEVQASLSGDTVRNGTITASGSEGLRVFSPLAGLSQVQVTTSGSYGFRGLAQNLSLIAPDSISYDLLLGNGRDTLVITAGSISGVTQLVRPDLPWRIENDISVLDPGGLLHVLPGATVALTNTARITFNLGGRLWARGTATDKVRFRSVNSTDHWETLNFLGTTTDTSYVTNAVVERGGRTLTAVRGESATHPLVIDSTQIVQSRDHAAWLNARGSRISRTLIDGTSVGTGVPAVYLNANTLMEESVVRNALQYGIQIDGDSVVVQTVEVTGSGLDGIVVTQRRGVRINDSNLFGNAGAGVRNTNTTNATYLIDATDNWWGDDTGPDGPNSDGYSLNVTVTPFLGTQVIIPLPLF